MAISNPPSASPRTAIDTLAWLIEEAFEEDPSHSLLANLRAPLQGTDRWPYE